MKVRNLKANHSAAGSPGAGASAVLATVKVRNLKANHSQGVEDGKVANGCISYCESTKSES